MVWNLVLLGVLTYHSLRAKGREDTNEERKEGTKKGSMRKKEEKRKEKKRKKKKKKKKPGREGATKWNLSVRRGAIYTEQ